MASSCSQGPSGIMRKREAMAAITMSPMTFHETPRRAPSSVVVVPVAPLLLTVSGVLMGLRSGGSDRPGRLPRRRWWSVSRVHAGGGDFGMLLLT